MEDVDFELFLAVTGYKPNPEKAISILKNNPGIDCTYEYDRFDLCFITLLHESISMFFHDLMNALLDSGADPNKDSSLGLPLQVLIDISTIYRFQNKPFEIFRDMADDLIRKGADVNKAVMGRGTALKFAIDNNHNMFARYLLDKGADPNVACDVWDGDKYKTVPGGCFWNCEDQDLAEDLFTKYDLQYQKWMKNKYRKYKPKKSFYSYLKKKLTEKFNQI